MQGARMGINNRYLGKEIEQEGGVTRDQKQTSELLQDARGRPGHYRVCELRAIAAGHAKSQRRQALMYQDGIISRCTAIALHASRSRTKASATVMPMPIARTEFGRTARTQ